ncbi:MAG: elongation factor G [Candidatus Dormibacteraeota bacterium]|nr:elongation factor G [Candidatus Dormibacteraeota bacterium]
MGTKAAEALRNIALLGHSNDGKTTLGEAMLLIGGAIGRMGSTDQGTSVLDFTPEEQHRQISVDLAIGHCTFEGHRYTLLDTPGFGDFAGQVATGLVAADAALLVISPTPEVEVGTESAWAALAEDRTPRLVVVNKMDRDNADYWGAIDALRERLQPRPVALHLPIGTSADFHGVVDLMHKKAFIAGSGPEADCVEAPIPEDMQALVDERCEQVIEAAAEGDDELLEKYLEEGTLSEAEVERGLREGIVAGRVCPVVCCSALKLLGVRTLLRAIADLLPGPEVDADGPPAAHCFATTADPFVGRVSYLKVLSGKLRSDQQIENVTSGGRERLGQLFLPQGKDHENVPEAEAGSIVGVAKLQHTRAGDVLGTSVETRRPHLPEPVYRVAVFPSTSSDEDKMGPNLARIAEEDPTLRLEHNEETRQTVLAGLGDVHLEVVLEKLQRKYGVSARTELPRVAYRETVNGEARAEGRHVKQSGGHGQYGICEITLGPAGRGEGLIWEDKIFGGSIPQNFRPSVKKGIEDQMARGAVAGYPLVDIHVVLVDGKYHTVDSSDVAFQLAGALAVRKAVEAANPVLLEPILHVEVRVPDQNLGDLMSLLNQKRGRIVGTEPQDGRQVVQAEVPEAEMQRFALDLRSLTQGRGTFTASFSQYSEMPPHLARSLIEAHQAG